MKNKNTESGHVRMSSNSDSKQPKTRTNRLAPFRKLSKKQTIIVIVFVGVLLASIALTLYFVLTKSDESDKWSKEEYGNLIKKEYSYAIDIGDNEGFSIDTSWLGDRDAKKLSLITRGVNLVTIDDDFKIKFIQGAGLREVGLQIIEYYYENALVAKISVESVEDSIIIREKSDLEKILSGTQKTIVQVEDIDLDGTSLEILKFKGKYYGNHKRISNLVLSENGGFFVEPEGAYISSVVLDDVKANILTSKDTLYIGPLANKMTSTDVVFCLATGEIEVNIENAEGFFAIGGLVGEASCPKRNRNIDTTNELKNSQTTVGIIVHGKGNVFLGGIVGISRNVTVKECYSLGKINLKTLTGSELIGVTVGGIVGSLIKEYDVSLTNINGLDSTSRLYCYSDITVDISGGGDGIMINAGGVYGVLKNHNVTNSSHNGKITVKTGYCNLRLGGFAGEATCEVSLPMVVEGLSAKHSKINITSGGGVFAGGLVGVLKNVDYSRKNEAVQPTIKNVMFSSSEREQIVEEIIGYEEK